MGVNKVIYYGEVLVDMSQVTVTPETLEKGKTALNASGNLITGTHECPETEPTLQEKTVAPTTAQQTVTPDANYDGLSKVTVNAMPTATQATPSVSVNSSGLITASATQSAGYVSAGTKSATKQLTTQAAKTVTPTTSEQTAVASGVYTTGVVKVGAIPSTYVQPSGTFEVTENGTYDVKNYASVDVNVASSGGGGGGSLETCTLTIVSKGVGGYVNAFYIAHVKNGAVTYKLKHYGKNSTMQLKEEVLKGSFVIFYEASKVVSVTNTGGDVVNVSSQDAICFISPDAPDTVTITLSNS